MPSKSRLLSSTINKPTSLIGASIAQPDEVNLASFETASDTYATASDLPGTGIAGEQAFVTDTNRLYMWNGTGWFNIAIVNESPTWDSNGQPDAAYALDADSPQDATVITLAATDPDGLAINYSYVTSGSMDSMATISQDSSVFTITPKTEAQVGAGVELTGSITFRASDGINIIPAVSQFTISFISIIENSKYTNLLATADGTSDNNNITDASSNNHSITVSGDAHAGTFSPYRSGGYSVYLPATENNISFAHDAGFNFGSGDFTIEFSIYFPSTNSGNDYLFQHGESTGSWNITTYNGYVFLFLNGLSIGQDIVGDSSYTISNHLNEWINYAIVRSGSTVTMYRNGTSVATKTSAQNANVGATLDTTNSEYLHINRRRSGTGDGTEFYFKDFRVTKGLARTISNNTEPLTSDANTSILVGSLPYIGDASSNAHTATFIGTPSTKTFSPYDYTEYSATDHGGSVYFTGTAGDKLTVSNQASNWSDTGTATIEFWFHSTRTPSTDDGDGLGAFWGDVQSVTATRFDIETSSNDLEFRSFSDAAGNGLQTVTIKSALTPNTWYHLAAVKNGQVWKFYVNGVLEHTHTQSTTYNWGSYASGNYNNYVIGQTRNAVSFQGYITDVRVSSNEVYTAAFTPSTAPLSSTGALVHIKGTDASIIDKSQSGNLELSGNVTGSTTQVKFAGSKSMYFPGSLGDQIIAISGENVDLSSADPFTWEAWCYFNSVSGVIHLMTSEDVGFTQDRIAFELRNSKLAAMFGGSVIQSGSQVLSTGQWYHLAISRAVGTPYTTTRFFVNGNLDQTATAFQQAVAIGSFDKWYIGSPTTNNISNGYNEFNGYMQDVRFTEGLTRYTANFTPPTKSLEG